MCHQWAPVCGRHGRVTSVRLSRGPGRSPETGCQCTAQRSPWQLVFLDLDIWKLGIPRITPGTLGPALLSSISGFCGYVVRGLVWTSLHMFTMGFCGLGLKASLAFIQLRSDCCWGIMLVLFGFSRWCSGFHVSELPRALIVQICP